MTDLPEKLTVAVHDGIFHADEVFAVAGLSFLRPNLEVIRTRDPKILKSCDLRVDVGDDYNPAKNTYDHHMSWFNIRHKKPYRRKLLNGEFREYQKGPLRSGFGLIWMDFGLKIVQAIVNDNYPEKDNELVKSLSKIDYIDIQQDIDNNLVARIDAIDNGEIDEFDLNLEPFRTDDLSKIISAYNPSVMENRNMDAEQRNALALEKFMKAVHFAKTILTSNVLSRVELNYFREIFMKLLEEKDPNIPVMVLEEYIPWSYGYGRAGDATAGVEMVVYPSTSGGWMCQTPRYYEKRDAPYISTTMKDGTKRKYKHKAPEAICGKREEELEKLTGIKDLIFVHKGGWLGAAKTKEAAYELAEYIIQHGE